MLLLQSLSPALRCFFKTICDCHLKSRSKNEIITVSKGRGSHVWTAASLYSWPLFPAYGEAFEHGALAPADPLMWKWSNPGRAKSFCSYLSTPLLQTHSTPWGNKIIFLLLWRSQDFESGPADSEQSPIKMWQRFIALTMTQIRHQRNYLGIRKQSNDISAVCCSSLMICSSVSQLIICIPPSAKHALLYKIKIKHLTK